MNDTYRPKFGMLMNGQASPYGNCHRCGAPKAPMMCNGFTMNLCTKCSSAEDQKMVLDMEERVRKLNSLLEARDEG